MININLSNLKEALKTLVEKREEEKHHYHIELDSMSPEDSHKRTLYEGDIFQLHNNDDPTHPTIDINFESVEEKGGKFHHTIKIFLNPWKRDALLEMIEGEEK